MHAKKSKKSLALDVDGVIIDLVPKICEMNPQSGVCKEDITEYGLSTVPQLSIDAFMKSYKDIWDLQKSNWNKNIITPLDSNIPAIIYSLSANYEIYVVTASIDPSSVYKWLIKNNIIISRDHFISCKAEEKVNYNFDIYIDDYPEIAKKVAETNKIAIVYKQPWNALFLRNNRNKNIIPVDDWNGINRILEDIALKQSMPKLRNKE
jgi:5'(3')-deoxyribonucleotidase